MFSDDFCPSHIHRVTNFRLKLTPINVTHSCSYENCVRLNIIKQANESRFISEINVVLSNSFGFGGTNASVIFGKAA